MKEELRHELVRLTYSPEIVSFELTREQGLEILEEIKRLNNIINELEKYIKTDAKIELYKDVSGFRTFVDGQDLLNKLQELKGVDKE